MQYRFDIPVDRRGTYSNKWNVLENELPMWVADMDFQTAPEIISEMRYRVEHGVFGYPFLPDEWSKAVVGWWEKRYDFSMNTEWLLYCTGVIPAINSIIRKLTSHGEKIVVQTPVYSCFFDSILHNGRQMLENPLKYENGVYRMDYEDLEEKLSDPQTTMMIICNPHNPVGRTWTKEELEKVGELCLKHHVLVVADEIHCDLTSPGVRYTPYASVSEKYRQNSITCIAPTKTFNLAGLKTAAAIVEDEAMRNKIAMGFRTDGVADLNIFAAPAAIVAYTKGEAWLDSLREYLEENRNTVREFLENNLPEIKLVKGNATYLLWLDCTAVWKDSEDLAAFLRKETGLFVLPGAQYGTGGKGFLRVNMACPRVTLQEGLEKLKQGILAYRE